MKSNSLHYYMLKSYACSICVLLILLFFTLPACSHQSEEIVPTTSVETTEILITETTEIPIAETQPLDLEQESISERCAEIMAVYYDTYMAAEKTAHDDYWKTQVLSPRSIDAIENILIEEGFDVMDSNGYYPAYLTTPAKFYNFWESVQSGESAEQEIITVTEQGNLFYTLLRYSSGTCFAYFMNCGFESDGSIEVTFFECHTVKDMELTDKGNFYYRIYPADDKHYADYSLVRLAPPDLELYDMTRKYIIPVNYVGVNLFLCDWSETDYGELSVNDLWEYIYYASYGEQFASGMPTAQTGMVMRSLPLTLRKS